MNDHRRIWADRIRAEGDIEILNFVAGLARERVKELGKIQAYTMQRGDKVLYVGTSYAARLVPSVSIGIVESVARTRAMVNFGREELPYRVRVPLEMLQRVLSDSPPPVPAGFDEGIEL